MADVDRITIELGKRSGKPCIRGLRIAASDELDSLASGMSEEDLLRDFPDLTREDIRACLAFAADRERRLVAVGGRWSFSSTRISPHGSASAVATSGPMSSTFERLASRRWTIRPSEPTRGNMASPSWRRAAISAADPSCTARRRSSFG